MRYIPRWSRRRWLVALLFLGACLATLVVAFYLIERWRGEQAWKAYQEEATKAGVKLKFAEFVPPEIPDAENFAAIPLIANVFEADALGKPESSVFSFPEVPGAKRPTQKAGEPFNSKGWRDFLIACGWLEKATDDAARDVLRGLDKQRQQLDALHEAGLRPHARFPIRWESGFAAHLPHLSTLQQAVNLFCLRASAHVELGENDQAYTNVEDALNIHRALEKEPLMIHAAVRVAMLGRVLSVIEQGLQGGKWSDVQLQGFERLLARIDVLKDWVFAVESERALITTEMAPMANGPGEDLAALLAITEGGPQEARMASTVYPRGWLLQNLVLMNRLFDGQREQIDLEKGMLRNRTSTEDIMTKLVGGYSLNRLRYALVHLLFPALDSLQARHLYALARLQQVRAACAVERYRRSEGMVPERLDALVPGYLAKVPHDPIDGAPLRFRWTAERGVVLWSVGLDGKDDGGQSKFEEDPVKATDWVSTIGPSKKVSP